MHCLTYKNSFVVYEDQGKVYVLDLTYIGPSKEKYLTRLQIDLFWAY